MSRGQRVVAGLIGAFLWWVLLGSDAEARAMLGLGAAAVVALGATLAAFGVPIMPKN